MGAAHPAPNSNMTLHKTSLIPALLATVSLGLCAPGRSLPGH